MEDAYRAALARYEPPPITRSAQETQVGRFTKHVRDSLVGLCQPDRPVLVNVKQNTREYNRSEELNTALVALEGVPMHLVDITYLFGNDGGAVRGVSVTTTQGALNYLLREDRGGHFA